MFNVWGAYVSLSAAIGRRVWLPFADRYTYANLYVMYVGKAGNGKSTAMGFVRKLIYETDSKIQVSGSVETAQYTWVFMAGDKTNPDKIIEGNCLELVRAPSGALVESHPYLILANEFINFISTDDKNWISGLNDIFDQDIFRYSTKNKGTNVVHGPYVVMLAALTNEGASEMQKNNIIQSGLARRTIFQYGERDFENPKPWPILTPEQVAAYGRCLAHMKVLRKVAGQFTVTDDAMSWWMNWYCENSRMVPKRSPTVESWYSSRPDQVKKLAMLTSLSESTDLIIRPQHFIDADAWLQVLEKDLYKIFGGAGRNELAGVSVKVIEFLAAQPEPIAKKRLITRLWNNIPGRDPGREIDNIINYLKQTDQIMECQMVDAKGNLIVGDTLIATPEIMKRFASAHAQQQGGATNGSHQGPAPAVGP